MANSIKATEPSFQAYQRAFTQHIRHPKTHARPMHVPIKRMAIYTEIVYNNIEGIVAACFPVAKNVLGAKKWQRLVRGFMANYRASTPIFREIPAQFLQYLNDANDASLKLPQFLASLMHYEWVELALSVMDVPTPAAAPEDVLCEPISLNPALFLLQYDFPVHTISASFQPKKPAETPTYLLVYRDAGYKIQFIELNPMTFQLVALLQHNTFTGEQVLQQLAANNTQIAAPIVLQFGAQTLEELCEKGVIFAVKKAQSMG